MAKRVLIIFVVASVILVLLAVSAGVYFMNSSSSCGGGSLCNQSQDSCSNGTSCMHMQHCYDLHGETTTLDDVILFSCRDRKDQVCCPHPKNPNRTAEDKMRLLPNDECGPAIGQRISQGQDADLGQFPWMALLGFNPNGYKGPPVFRCGGTLINERYVLTAAHCMEHGLPVFVRLGEYDLSKDLDSEEGIPAEPHVDVLVEKVIRHKLFNTTSLKNDIALIRLKKKVPESSNIIPVCLPFGVNITGEEEVKFTVAGWGKVENDNANGSNILQFATIPSVPISECSEGHERRVLPIDRLQLCAGGMLGKDVCKGDSGGPLLQTTTDNKGGFRMYQVGITSFGHVSCGGEVPSVFTRITPFLNWILNHLDP